MGGTRPGVVYVATAILIGCGSDSGLTFLIKGNQYTRKINRFVEMQK